MKTILNFFLAIAAMLLVASCEKLEFDPTNQTPPTDTTSNGGFTLSLKSGSAVETGGNIYAQINTGVNMEAVSTDPANPLVSASWTIGGTTYSGLEITHKFTTLGDHNISISVTHQNGTTETKNFIIKVVTDMSPYDPIRRFSSPGANGSYNVWLLFSKERIRHNGNNYGYVGNVTGSWSNPAVTVPAADTSYVITNNSPVAVTNIGSYVAVKMLLAPGDYSMGMGYFTVVNGTTQLVWGNFAGSACVLTANPTLVSFRVMPDGSIVGLGDGTGINPVAQLPGESGDEGENAVLRFTQIGDSATGTLKVYFNHNVAVSGISPFGVKRSVPVETFGSPMAASAVADYPKWSVLEIPLGSTLGYVTAMKFGDNISSPSNFNQTQMLKSSFWDGYFGELRFTVVKLKSSGPARYAIIKG